MIAPSLRACRKYGERTIHADDFFVCTLDDSELDSEHDELLLNLFAAAPDLLAALKECERYLVLRGVETRGTVGRTVVLPKIRAAIAKAEGGVPL